MTSSTQNNNKKNTRFFKYSAIFGGLLLASWLTLGYNKGPEFAAKKNYPTLLRSFLYLPGVDVTKADDWGGETPLYWAAFKGHTECVKLLIEAKADVNKANEYGYTPLYWAALLGHTECVKLLIDAGADVNKKVNNWGHTPLHVAKTEEIKRLLREAAEKKPATEQADENEPQAVPEQETAKSRLQQQNNTLEKYNTALLEAAEKGNSELMSQLLTAGTDVNKADKDGQTPLYWAAYKGHTECVKLLIDAGADINMANKYGWTPLREAAYNGRTECVKQLIAAGADVNKANWHGQTPLYLAATGGHKECVEQLIDAGADVNMADKEGKTPLYLAALWGHTECVKQLTAAKADVNKATNWGSTPLYIAASGGHTECVKLLIDAGADVNKEDKYGSTPLRAAKTEEIKQLLRKAGAR